MDRKEIASLAQRVRDNIARVIVGKNDTVELLLTCLIARGHVLMEDVPGTGKTMLAKSLARSLDCGFARIQFTPDLLPGDVTGISVFNAQKAAFEFKPGPVFTHILLADEINRATPRTQSSLLECMEERQVTQDGVTRPLEEPFMVVATQNPIETQGTFPLPEAQLDRFLMRLRLGYPTSQESMDIMRRFICNDPLSEISPVATREDIRAAQKAFVECHVSEPVLKYISDICERTRAMPQVNMGASPRGMLALLRASQAYALIKGRDFVTPDDVKTLARPVLAHRIIMSGLYGHASQAEDMVWEAVSGVTVPTENPERT